MARYVVSVAGHKIEGNTHTVANEVLVCTRDHQLAAEGAGLSAFHHSYKGFAIDTLVVLDITENH